MGPVDATSRKLSVLEPLELRLIPADGLIFDEALPIHWLRAGLGETTDTGEAIEILQEGRAHLTVRALGEVQDRPPILVEGRFDAQVRTPCVRCLSDVLLDLGEPISTTLFPAPEAPKKATGKPKRAEAPSSKKGGKADKKSKKGGKDDARLEDWTGEDVVAIEALDETGYVGETIDLPSVLEEALVLSMDLNPCCADEPACDARTQALLDEVNAPAQQAETAPDPRWAALQQMINPESQDS